MPKVSVLTPLYNTALSQLREMVESVLGQTYTDFELILLNDSPNNLELEQYVKNFSDPRIKYYKNTENIGISDSRNKLITLAQGEYLAICDHDDISLPSRFELQVNYLDKHPDVGVVSGLCEVFGSGNHSFQKHPENDYEIRMKLLLGCYIAHPACMIRKSVLIDNNIQYNSLYTPAEDYKLFLDLIQFTHFYNIQKVILKYRSFDNNTSVLQQKKMQEITDLIQAESRDKYSSLYRMAQQNYSIRLMKIKLFNLFTICTIYSDKIVLFDFLPILKLKRY